MKLSYILSNKKKFSMAGPVKGGRWQKPVLEFQRFCLIYSQVPHGRKFDILVKEPNCIIGHLLKANKEHRKHLSCTCINKRN